MAKVADSREDRGLQGVDRVVRLIEVLAAGPAPLSRVASEAGLSDATTFRYLGSLVFHGLLERDPVSRPVPHIGLRMFMLGRSGDRDDATSWAPATTAMARLGPGIGQDGPISVRGPATTLVIVHATRELTANPEGRQGVSETRTTGTLRGFSHCHTQYLAAAADAERILDRKHRTGRTHPTAL